MTGIIILAAGASTRLGQPKQLLVYKEKTLLQHAIDTAIETRLQPVVVVLGSQASLIKKAINQQGANLVEHTTWQQGMASSMQAGLSQVLLLHPDIESIIIMLCDQPFVNSKLLLHLVEHQVISGKAIVASSYDNTLGPPVLFTRSCFKNLFALAGNEGAKKLILLYAEQVAEVCFEEGKYDIDTPNDLETLS